MDLKHIKGNTYAVDTGFSHLMLYKLNEKDCVLMDTGYNDEEWESLKKILVENSLFVKGVIISHAHIDHMGNVKYIKEMFDAKFALSFTEAALVNSIIDMKNIYANLATWRIKEYYERMKIKIDVMIFPDEDEIDFCGAKFKILHTPGHSNGHIVIISPDNVAYIGDGLITEEEIKSVKLLYTYYVDDDIISKKKIADLNCDGYIMSHSGTTKDIRGLANKNLDFLLQCILTFFDALEDGMTMDDLLLKVSDIISFKGLETSVFRYYNLLSFGSAYLQFLENIGAVKLKMNGNHVCYYKNNRNLIFTNM